MVKAILALVPYSEVVPVYSVQEVLCVLIILLLILLVIFETKLWIKIAITVLALITALLHYYVIAMTERYGSVTILPLLLLERSKQGYAAISPDYGQLLIALSIVLWRRELGVFLKKALRSL